MNVTQMVLTAADFLNLSFIVDIYMNVMKRWSDRREIKQTIKELNKLTDRDLRDLGISRGEIYSVASGAWRRDSENQTNENLRGWV
jgi:uncharacterized protein YjiS (DUF1127 family)